MTGIGRTVTDRRISGQMKAPVERVGEVMELKELDVMAIGGTHEDPARGFQTWGTLL